MKSKIVSHMRNKREKYLVSEKKREKNDFRLGSGALKIRVGKRTVSSKGVTVGSSDKAYHTVQVCRSV